MNNARAIMLMEETAMRWTEQHRYSVCFNRGTVVASMSVNYLRPPYYQPNAIVRLSVVPSGSK